MTRNSGEGQLTTNVSPEITLQLLPQALTAVNANSVIIDNYSYAVSAKTGATLSSWGQRITCQVGQAAPGTTTVSVSSTPIGQLVDWGRGKDESRKIVVALEGLLRRGATAQPGWNNQPPLPPGQPWQFQPQGQFPGMGINNSGMGDNSILPAHLRRFHWAAFLFNWIWALANQAWGLGLLTLAVCWIPFFGQLIVFCVACYLGSNGYELAWKNRRWDSVEHFERTQKIWTNWAVAWLVFVIFCIFVAVANSS